MFLYHVSLGRGAKSPGYHTRKGGYVVVPNKIYDIVVPDLTGFKLKPYVSHKTPNVVCQPFAAQELLDHLKPSEEGST